MNAVTSITDQRAGALTGVLGADSQCPPPGGNTPDTLRQMNRWLGFMGEQLRQAYLESTRALIAAVEAKDAFTEQHSSRVSNYAKQISVRMGLSAENAGSVATAAMLHDIGKIGVPDAILNKPGPLREEEFAVVKKHPGIAIEILGHTTYLQRELPSILHHHERYDGTGYPAGLSAQQIPIGASILNVADALDAMLSKRCYKSSMTLGRAKMELVRCKGKQFDPDVVDATMGWLADADAGRTRGPKLPEQISSRLPISPCLNDSAD